MIPKAAPTDTLGRFREIVADPCNALVPRVPEAGLVGRKDGFLDDYVVMHNGQKTLLGTRAYYGEMASILVINRGVHEPQEEYCFGRILSQLDGSLPMIELGSYWAFYSMWYLQRFPSAEVYMIDADDGALGIGMANFMLNGLDGEFEHGAIQPDGYDIAGLLSRVGKVAILHADIQGSEEYLLDAIADALAEKAIQYLFVSTHSQRLHLECVRKVEAAGYTVIADADFDNDTFSYDGLVVAAAVAEPRIEVGSRASESTCKPMRAPASTCEHQQELH